MTKLGVNSREAQFAKPTPSEPCVYRIVVEGELGSRYDAAFTAMRLEARNGRTEIVGAIKDQAEPHGIIDAIAALGLPLVSAAPLGE